MHAKDVYIYTHMHKMVYLIIFINVLLFATTQGYFISSESVEDDMVSNLLKSVDAGMDIQMNSDRNDHSTEVVADEDLNSIAEVIEQQQTRKTERSSDGFVNKAHNAWRRFVRWMKRAIQDITSPIIEFE